MGGKSLLAGENRHGGMLGKIDGFRDASWIFNVKNRLGWHNKSETTHTGVVGVSEIPADKAMEMWRDLRSGEACSKDDGADTQSD